jgi:hypothetical protein
VYTTATAQVGSIVASTECLGHDVVSSQWVGCTTGVSTVHTRTFLGDHLGTESLPCTPIPSGSGGPAVPTTCARWDEDATVDARTLHLVLVPVTQRDGAVVREPWL